MNCSKLACKALVLSLFFFPACGGGDSAKPDGHATDTTASTDGAGAAKDSSATATADATVGATVDATVDATIGDAKAGDASVVADSARADQAAADGSTADGPVADAAAADKAPADGPAADVAPPKNVGEACLRVVADFCAKFNSCAPLFIQNEFGDVKTCEARLLIDCLNDGNAPGTGQTVDNILACQAIAKAATCSQFVSNRVTSCDTKGALADAAACGSDAQCKSGYCAKNSNSTCGTCSPVVGVGKACQDDSGCEAGLSCGDTRVCLKTVSLGEACDNTNQCAGGFYCKAAKCAAAAETVGAACDGDGSCNFLQGLYCTAAKVCAAIKTAATGEACGAALGTAAVCTGGGKCSPNEQNGTCQKVAKDGEVCSDTIRCLTPAVCSGGKCVLPDSAACK